MIVSTVSTASAITSTSVTVVTANPSRVGIVLTNTDPVQPIYICFAATATIAAANLILFPNSSWTWPYPGERYTDVISAISTAKGSNLIITEFNYLSAY